MSSKPPPKTPGIASLLWDLVRLSAKALWGSRVNPVRPIVERQQALAVLGLPPDATHQQIKRRYRELAKKYHPDLGGDQKEMRRIIAAYQLLKKSSTS